MLASLSSFAATPIVIATSYPVSGDPVTVGICASQPSANTMSDSRLTPAMLRIEAE